MLPLLREAGSPLVHRVGRLASTMPDPQKYRIVVVGAGSGGLAVANQIYQKFKSVGNPIGKGSIAILDANDFHYYQPGWTLVGSGLKPKTDFQRPLAKLIPSYFDHIRENAATFNPQASSLTTTTGRTLSYDALVVAAGLQINWNAIKGLNSALIDSSSGVSSIYSHETCNKTWADIDSLRSGRSVYTQPSGIIKCAGAPQKIMWMAYDRYRKTGRGNNIKVDFYTGMPTMFSVKKYSEALDGLRQERGIGGYFQHNLTSVDPSNHKATFTKSDGTSVVVDYTTLHVTPPMGPLDFLKTSPIVNKDGWVSVDQSSLRHTEYSNIFAIGDCSSLPTSKTAAAITSQAPVLTENLYSVLTSGNVSSASYDGYTSCPLLTGYGELMLAEFKYGLEPKESFSYLGDQAIPSRLFYHLKKDIFPAAYWNFHVKGKWFGVHGLKRPSFT